MYGTGFRKPDGVEYGFAERSKGGKTRFLFVNYFEERTDLSPDMDLVKRLSDSNMANFETNGKAWENFNPSPTDLKDVDNKMRSLFKKVKEKKAFKGHPLSEK